MIYDEPFYSFGPTIEIISLQLFCQSRLAGSDYQWPKYRGPLVQRIEPGVEVVKKLFLLVGMAAEAYISVRTYQQ